MFKFCKSVKGTNGVAAGLLIEDVTTMRGEDSTRSPWHAPFKNPIPQMPQGRTTKACCTVTRNCAAVFGGLSMSWIWTAIWSQIVLWSSDFSMANPWLPRPGSVGNPWLLGLCGTEHYLEPEQIGSRRWLLRCVRHFVAAHVFILAGSWCSPAQPADFCHHNKTQTIWWRMDHHSRLFPAHRHQCAFHPTIYIPELVHLCDATQILTRRWRYSVAGGECPKQDGVLNTDGGADDVLKSV